MRNRLRKVWSLGCVRSLTGLSVIALGVIGVASPAFAADTGRVDATAGLWMHTSASVSTASQISVIPYNTTITIDCTVPNGPSVTGPYGATSLWDHTSYNGATGYVSDAWIYTGTASAVAPTCGSSTSTSASGTVDASPCLNFRTGPSASYSQAGCIPDGTSVVINCTLSGTAVSGPYGTTSIWDQTNYASTTGYVSDAWVYTGTASAVAGNCTAGTPPATANPTGSGNVIASPCLNFRNGPSGSDGMIGCIPYGTPIAITCTASGSAVTGPYGTTSVWDQTNYASQTGYVSDAWVYTGTNSAIAGSCTNDNQPTSVSPPATVTSTVTGKILASPYLNFHTSPSVSSSLESPAGIPYGTVITVACQTSGSSVSGPYGSESIWDQTNFGGVTGYVSDAWVYTGVNSTVTPGCSTPPSGGSTSSVPPPTTPTEGFETTRAAILYQAQLHPSGTTYPSAPSDPYYGQCFDFVKQVLLDASGGKIVISTGTQNYKTAYTQGSAHAVPVSPALAEPGDVIQIAPPNGFANSNGTGIHTMIIVSNNNNGDYTVIDQNYDNNKLILTHDFDLSQVPRWWPGSQPFFWQLGSRE